MKQNILNKMSAILVIALILGMHFSCSQLETFESQDLDLTESIQVLNKGDFTPLGYGYDPFSLNRTLYDPAVVCDDPEEYCVSSSNYYYKEDDKAFTGQGFGGARVEYFQRVDEKMVYKFVSYEGNNKKSEFLKGYQVDDGEIVNFTGNRSSFELEFDLDEDWEACDEVTRKITLYKGNPNAVPQSVDFETSYVLLPLCDDGGTELDDDECEEEDFFYDQVIEGVPSGVLRYTFTYIPCEDLTGAVVKFTSPHIKGFTSLDGKFYTINKGKKRGTPTVMTWVGDIPAGGITFEVDFNPDCTQTNSGKANVWTDFKVNEVSKKFANSNIIAWECGSK